MLTLIVAGYIALALIGYFLSEKIIFQPPHSSYHDGPGILKLPTADGKHISAVYLPLQSARYTILFSHGNAEDIGDNLEFFADMQRAGFAVFAYDYHGYGTSEGVPTEKTIEQDAEASYDYLTQALHVSPDHIIVMGRSVGSGPAVYLGSQHPVAGLIVRSGFLSAFRVLTRIPLLPFDRFNNLARMKKVSCPVLIMHGRADEVIPFWHGEKLFAAAPGPKMQYWLNGAGHNDFEAIAGAEYWNVVQQFASTLQH